MASLIGLPPSLLIDITNKAATQVFLGMGQDHSGSCPRVLEHVMRTGDAFQNRSVALKPTLDIKAIGEHWPRTITGRAS